MSWARSLEDQTVKDYLVGQGFSSKSAMLSCVANGDMDNADNIIDSYINNLRYMFTYYGLQWSKSTVLYIYAQASGVAVNEGLDNWVSRKIAAEMMREMDLCTDVEQLLFLCRQLLLSYVLAVHRMKSECTYSPLVQSICNYLIRNIHKNITISDLSEIFHFSESNLSHRFKRETGFSIQQYIQKQKIVKSMLLLKKGCQMSWVANKLGFCSQSYFIKIFKKVTSMTPSEWLKSGCPM